MVLHPARPNLALIANVTGTLFWLGWLNDGGTDPKERLPDG